MAKKPRKKKKYNKQKGYDADIAGKLKGMELLHVASMTENPNNTKCDIYHYGEPVNPRLVDARLVAALDMRRLNWTVCLVIVCRDWEGNDYIVTEQIAPTEPRTREQLGPTLLAYHKELKASCNPKDIIQTGWVASALPHEYEDEYVFDLLIKSGAFSFLSRRQHEELDNA